MARYLISFDDGAMDFPEEDLPAVGAAARAVVAEASDAGVWVFSAGVLPPEGMSVVAVDGTVTDGPPADKAYVGGFAVVETATRDEALGWAARIARACRCAQEVRELVPDPGE